MTYYRLRDIKTPPFAYVLNKDVVLHTCWLCQMPFQELRGPLEVEICTTESGEWEERINGKPLMADHWLIGDELFGERIETICPGMFRKTPVKIVSWLARSPMDTFSDPGELLKVQQHSTQPGYFHFKPKTQIELAAHLLESFPPMKCCECQREIPEIPIDFQPVPNLKGPAPSVVSLEGLYLEGYDYLFHQDILSKLESEFPGMILEKLAPEPLAI